MTTRISVFGLAAVVFLLCAAGWPAAAEVNQESGGVVTFYKDVLPILQKNCQSCHRPGQIGPMSLMSHKEARPWAKAIKAAVLSKKMPPWFADPQYGHFNNDRSLKPVEILPGQPSVVHHFCFNFEKHKPTTEYNVYEWMEVPRDDDGVSKNRSRGVDTKEGIVIRREVGRTEETRRQGIQTIRGGNEFCYLPGLPYEDYRPVNAGVFVPSGSDIVMSLHYTPNGVALVDRTRIGFTVAKVPPAKGCVPQDGEDGQSAPI